MKDTLFLIYNDLIKEKTKKERLVLMLSLSVFLPYVFTAIALIIACVFAFLDKDFTKGFLERIAHNSFSVSGCSDFSWPNIDIRPNLR